MSNQASPSTTQRIRKRWRETRREPRRTLSSEQTSATPKQNLKVRSQQLFERVSAFVSHATVEIIPQNGFSYIRLNQEYLYESIVSPTRTFIDIRDKADYKQLHIRTAINIPHTYFTLPPVQAALRQLEETKKEESTFSCESLLSEEELQANREILKHSWVDDILQHSVQQNKHHEFLIYASYTKVKRSQVIAQIIHVLKAIYQQYIEFGQLSIFVIKTRFDKLCTERWMPLLCVSTDAYRKTQGYMDMDFTDDDVYTKILPFLYLSSSIGATNKDRLAKAGITVILNLTEREIEYPQGNFEIIHIAMADIRKQNTAGPIEKANSIIETARKNFGRVLVHCTRGQSRSPVIAIAYLMKARGWSLLKSYLFVREKRPWIGPNPSFMSQLMMYECQLHIFAPSTFPLHAYTLLESRDEDFDENILALRLTVDDSQILFNIIENNDLSYAIELVTQEPNLKYIRKTGADDETPLHSVLGNAGLERKQILELINLLTDVIVVTRCTLAGETPLHMAARNADKYLVDLFLKNGARVKATTLDGTNVLHCAAIWVGKTHSAEALEVLTSLVKSAGCSKVVVPDIHTFTPLDYTKLCKEAYTVILRKFVQELFIPDHSQEVTKENIRNNICLIVNDILCTLIWQELYNQFFHDQMKHDPILQCLVLQYHEFCSICQKILPADLCPQGKGHREISEFEVIDFLIEVVKKIIISQPNNLFFENVNSLLPNEIDSYGIVMCHPDVFKLVLNSDTNIVNDTIQTVFPSLNCKQIANILQSASKILYETITEVSAQEN